MYRNIDIIINIDIEIQKTYIIVHKCLRIASLLKDTPMFKPKLSFLK